jgi:hypothetical protein
MSHAAVSAVLAHRDLSAGERLVAWSLASFANREQLAWPGIAAATARAGLGRSRYLEAREQLVRRGLLKIEKPGVGRGKASAVRLVFAHSGPWWETEVNVELLEAVLGYSRQRGPARLLLAALAALSDSDGVVEGVATAELCRTAGLANSTYRRARAALLASGEVAVDDANGGRGRTCRWTIRRPAELGAEPRVELRRRAVPAGASRPLVAAARTAGGAAVENGPVLSGVSVQKGPILSAVSARKGPIPSGVSSRNTAETPPETPSHNARAGSEPQNPRIEDPPSPPEGGSRDTEVFIEETYRTDRGRLRRRRVVVDVETICARLSSPALTDAVDWKRICERMGAIVGWSTFEIWLAALELRAVDASRALVVDAPDATRSWVRKRFGRVIAEAATEIGRAVIVADEAQSQAMRAFGLDPVGVAAPMSAAPSLGGSSFSSACASYSSSACPLSYTSSYNQAKEVG